MPTTKLKTLTWPGCLTDQNFPGFLYYPTSSNFINDLIQIFMSTYFSKLIKAGDKLREFNFRQTYLNDDSRYTVDVPDDKGNRIMFSIYRNADAAWKVAAQLMPMWVHNAEQELATAIEENNE